MSVMIQHQDPIISPLQEFLAYEALWDMENATPVSISKKLQTTILASDLVEVNKATLYKDSLLEIANQLPHFGIRVHGDGEFPDRLSDAKNPLKLLYYQGDWQLTYLPSVAVVGTRAPTPLGRKNAEDLVRKLVRDKYVIVSGLARGIDTIAHETALSHDGKTIAVLGTPLNQSYPPENAELQHRIAQDHLLISQVPFIRYKKQDYRHNRFFFPERNITMSALTQATIIVEAGETSGTLIQARAALQQGRKLFILNNNFKNPALTWPQKFEAQGAIRVETYNDITKHLSKKI